MTRRKGGGKGGGFVHETRRLSIPRPSFTHIIIIIIIIIIISIINIMRI